MFHRTCACFSQRALTNLQHTSQSINHTKHTRQTKHRTLDRVVLREARRHAHPSLPRDRHAMPSRTTLLHAIPSRTDSRSTRPHIRDASRARVPDVARADGHERVFHNVRSSVCYIDEAPLHSPRTIPRTRVTKSSAKWVELCPGSCVRLFVSVGRFGGDSTGQMSRRCSFFPIEFG